MNAEIVVILLIALFTGISGINDGGNLVGTFLASRMISVRWLIPILIINIGIGPILFGTAVSHTVAVEVVDFQKAGMVILAISLFSALLTLLITWLLRVPSSTTIALTGGMIGGAWSNDRTGLIHWVGVLKVVGGMIGSIIVGFIMAYIITKLLWHVLRDVKDGTNRKFAYLQYITISLQGIAYGANDQEKAIGLTALYFMMIHHHTHYAVTAFAIGLPVLFWILGLYFGGLRIAQTVSGHILRLRALQAITTQMAAAITVIAAAMAGLPVSTTQTTDGCLFGMGAATEPRKVRWLTVQKLLWVWVLSFPSAIIIGYLSMAFLRII